MKNDEFSLPEGAQKMSPLDMNKIAILKAHTVITFRDDSDVAVENDNDRT